MERIGGGRTAYICTKLNPYHQQNLPNTPNLTIQIPLKRPNKTFINGNQAALDLSQNTVRKDLEKVMLNVWRIFNRHSLKEIFVYPTISCSGEAIDRVRWKADYWSLKKGARDEDGGALVWIREALWV